MTLRNANLAWVNEEQSGDRSLARDVAKHAAPGIFGRPCGRSVDRRLRVRQF